MTHPLLPATNDIADLFAERINDHGGTVTNHHGDGKRLIMRSVLPLDLEVRCGDAICGGVALRTHRTEVHVHPYLFREVCRNGAIAAWSAGTSRVERVDFAAPSEAVEEVMTDLAIAIDACTDEEHLVESVDRMRAAAGRTLYDPRNLLLTMLTQTSGASLERYIELINDQIEREGERTRYALMNAITAVARDTRDPDDQWRLEELGGGVLLSVEPTPMLDVALTV